MAYLEAWKRCLDFKGTTSRRKYWTAVIMHIVLCVVAVFCLATGLMIGSKMSADSIMNVIRGGLSVYGLAFTIPCVSMTVRRLRDAGHSPKSFFWLLVPAIGQIAFFARLCARSTGEHSNK